MIPEIINNKIQPVPQSGNVASFKRRKPEDGNLLNLKNPSPRQLYDYVRMLDGEGYPPAYIPLEQGRMEFYDASLKQGVFKAKNIFVKNE